MVPELIPNRMMARLAPTPKILSLGQKRRATIMAGNPDKLSVELLESPLRQPIEVFELLKAMISGPILDIEVQRNLCAVIFQHLRDRNSTREPGLSIRSIFQLALEESFEWMPFTIFEHEHESLLRTPRFLTLVVSSGSSPVVHTVLERVRSSAWTIQEQR